MKELRKECLRLALALERWWTPRTDKQCAAILLRNAACTEPVCSFCGSGPQGVVELYESRYDPKVMICRLCAREINPINIQSRTSLTNDMDASDRRDLTTEGA